MTRSLADRDSPRPDPHYLAFVDVAIDGDPTAGLRVEYRTVEQVEGGPNEGKDARKHVFACRAILATVARSPGCSVNEVKGANIGIGSAAAGQRIDALLGGTLGLALINRGETGKEKARALYLADGVDPATWEPPAGALVHTGVCPPSRALRCSGAGRVSTPSRQRGRRSAPPASRREDYAMTPLYDVAPSVTSTSSSCSKVSPIPS